jgi:hypothetical protein
MKAGETEGSHPDSFRGETSLESKCTPWEGGHGLSLRVVAKGTRGEAAVEDPRPRGTLSIVPRRTFSRKSIELIHSYGTFNMEGTIMESPGSPFSRKGTFLDHRRCPFARKGWVGKIPSVSFPGEWPLLVSKTVPFSVEGSQISSKKVLSRRKTRLGDLKSCPPRRKGTFGRS